MARDVRWTGRGPDFAERVTPERAQILADEAVEALQSEAYTDALELFGQSLRIYRKLSRRKEEADTLVSMAHCAESKGDNKEARAHYEEAIAVFRLIKDSKGLSNVLRALGLLELDRANYTYAVKLLHECSDICEKEAYREGYAVSLYLLSAAELPAGAVRKSRDLQERAEHAAGFTGESLVLAEAAARLARAAALYGDLPRAQAIFEDSIRQYRSAGYLTSLTPALQKTGRRSYLDGRLEMFVLLADGLQSLYSAGRNGRGQASAVREIGSLALRLGEVSSAYSLFKESMKLSLDPAAWRDRAACYLALGSVASREEHDDIARSLFDKGFATLNEGASGPELLERTIKMCRRVLYTEDLKAAALYFARCAAHARSLGEVTYYIQAQYYRGCVALQQGEYGAANRHLEECLIHYGEVGPVRRMGRTLTEKGSALAALGDSAKGRAYQNKGLQIARAENDEVGIIAALTALGSWPLEGSDGSFEKECLRQAIDACSGHEERYLHRGILCRLGDLERTTGSSNEACRLYLKCLMVMPQEGRLLAATAAAEGCAIVASGVGLYHHSVRLFGKAAAMRRRTGSAPIERNGLAIDYATSEARNKLSTAEFDAEWAAGEAFGMSETVQEAWSILESVGVINSPN